jgi:hypothetical protein
MRTLKEVHGMTLADYEAMWLFQGGRCLVCGHAEEILDIDHDHACVEHVGRGSCAACRRGPLCHHCNLALGSAKDNPATLRALADYLERAA